VLGVAIVAAAVVPHPPALLPGVTGRPIAEVEQLREAAAAAVRWVFEAGPDVVFAVSGADGSGECDLVPGAAADGFRGEPAGGGAPLGLAVLAALLPDPLPAPVVGYRVDRATPAASAAALGAELARRAARVGLLVAGDGSARRGPKAPGYLDERAAPFDAAVAQALADGDATQLLALDAGLADELLVAGRAPWQVLAGAVGGGAVSARLDYASDPFGVWYAVARWRIA
jgi:hypothetical protein